MNDEGVSKQLQGTGGHGKLETSQVSDILYLGWKKGTSFLTSDERIFATIRIKGSPKKHFCLNRRVVPQLCLSPFSSEPFLVT